MTRVCAQLSPKTCSLIVYAIIAQRLIRNRPVLSCSRSVICCLGSTASSISFYRGIYVFMRNISRRTTVFANTVISFIFWRIYQSPPTWNEVKMKRPKLAQSQFPLHCFLNLLLNRRWQCSLPPVAFTGFCEDTLGVLTPPRNSGPQNTVETIFVLLTLTWIGLPIVKPSSHKTLESLISFPLSWRSVSPSSFNTPPACSVR